MFARVLTQEFIATERRLVVLEALEGLETVGSLRPLTFTERAALDALQRIYSRTASHHGAVITPASIARPVAIAQRAMEAALCVP